MFTLSRVSLPPTDKTVNSFEELTEHEILTRFDSISFGEACRYACGYAISAKIIKARYPDTEQQAKAILRKNGLKVKRSK